MKPFKFALAALCVGALGWAAYATSGGELPTPDAVIPDAMTQRLRGQYTVADRQAQFGPAARARWQPFFDKANATYPPAQIVLLGLKQEKQLEVYARQTDADQWKRIRVLPIAKASGVLGPKLREGDRQVPEGFYALTSLNPNSAYHLSLRVGYPNLEDKINGLEAGRTERELGGNIMIHGGAASIGCLAMGDQAAEDLFVLAADAKPKNVQIVLSPLDFRNSKLPVGARRPAWLIERYAKLEKFVKALPVDAAPTS